MEKNKREHEKKGKIAEELLERFEHEWVDRKKNQAEELHNDLLEVITEHNADVYTLLFVLEMLKFEALQDNYSTLFGGKKLSDKVPAPMGSPGGEKG